MTGRPKVLIVGFGRLGGALARLLVKARWHVSVLPHSAASKRRVLRAKLRIAEEAELAAADLCLFCVPDPALLPAVAELAPRLSKRCALVHCAGALSLEALGSRAELKGRARGSFHPLCAVSSSADSLAGCSVALSSDSARLMGLLEQMAAALKLTALRVPENRRSAYHAGAVLGSGAVVAVLSAAVEALTSAGIDSDAALAALLALTESALRGVRARGLSGGMTGPVVRGDPATLARHLAALPRSVRVLYRPLILQMVRASRARLSASEARALIRVAR